MSIRSVHCPVLGAHVAQVTDLEGTVTRIICSEYSDSTGACRLRTSAGEGGPLGQLLERMSEGGLDTRSARCVLLSV